MALWGGLTNSCEKKRSEKQRRKGKKKLKKKKEKQRRKGKIFPFECRVPKNGKER